MLQDWRMRGGKNDRAVAMKTDGQDGSYGHSSFHLFLHLIQIFCLLFRSTKGDFSKYPMDAQGWRYCAYHLEHCSLLGKPRFLKPGEWSPEDQLAPKNLLTWYLQFRREESEIIIYHSHRSWGIWPLVK